MEYESLEQFKEIFFKKAGLFKKNFLRMEMEFGDLWQSEFNIHLEKLFSSDKSSDEKAYDDAVLGYSKFAIDGVRLQRLFNKKLKYEDVSYEEACEKVYMNENYMMTLYLPGIYVSNFLWRHHYKQYLFYHEKFCSLLDQAPDRRFYDVGTGTGFYTLQMFRASDLTEGFGIDISPHSRKFTLKNVESFGFKDRFHSINVNILEKDFEPLPFIQSVEVLEHLSDPQPFLNRLRQMLQKGGRGFITAALTAPNADHIYLYWKPEEVVNQLEKAGLKVLEQIEELAYEGQLGEHVPKVAAFIVT